MQSVRIEKGAGKKPYRINNMPSDIYTTTNPLIIMDTTVIPSPDTVTAPAQFMAYQGYKEEMDEYEVNMLKIINEISDFQEHIDSSVRVIPSPEIVTRPSTFKSFARKWRLLLQIEWKGMGYRIDSSEISTLQIKIK